MKKQNNSKISKPFGLFVVISVGVILMGYVALGLIATEVQVERNNAKMKQAKKVNMLKRAQQNQPKEAVMVKNVRGTVMSVEDNLVMVQSSLGTDESYNVKLNLNDEDLALVKLGDEMTAVLETEVDVEMIEDGPQEVANIVVQEAQQE